MNVRIIDDATVGLAFGETLTKDDVAGLLSAFGVNADLDAIAAKTSSPLGADQRRNTPFLTHPVFNTHHSEHMMLRYGAALPYRARPVSSQGALCSQSPIHFHSPPSLVFLSRYLKRLENRDLSLNTSMISLGSCTMKLNATSEMQPVTWPEFANIHPFAPLHQALGYKEMIDTLNRYELCLRVRWPFPS